MGTRPALMSSSPISPDRALALPVIPGRLPECSRDTHFVRYYPIYDAAMLILSPFIDFVLLLAPGIAVEVACRVADHPGVGCLAIGPAGEGVQYRFFGR